MTAVIKDIQAYTVFDSRGYPTVECVVFCSNGSKGRAIVPSGASTGRYEALELRDGHLERFGGKSVEYAVAHIEGEIKDALKGRKVQDQEAIDEMLIQLDGTAHKQRLGANAILAVSMAVANAAASAKRVPLYKYLAHGKNYLIPLPEIQIIGGGAHSNGRIDVQDFMIIAVGADSLMEAYEMTFNVYRQTGRILEDAGKLAGVADEGGYWPEFDSNEAVFEVLLKAIEAAGYRPGEEVALSLDIAASEFYKEGKYHLALEDRQLNPEAYFAMLQQWMDRYPICSVEDPFDEEDYDSWRKFTELYGERLQIIGDDLFVTHSHRVQMGIDQQLANSVLIKLNQVGTVTETKRCIEQTLEAGWRPVVSARSGETEDAFIAHLAVATQAGQLKVGSFTRSERMVKWNELIRIQRDLGFKAVFANQKTRFPWS